MALSYYSNWGPQVLDQYLKQDQTSSNITTKNYTSTSVFFPHQEQLSHDHLVLPPELLNFHDNFDTCIDPLFSQNNLFQYYSDNDINAADAYACTLSPSAVPLINTLPPVLEMEEACFDHFYPKRMKVQEDYFLYPELMNIHNYYDNNEMGFVPNPPLLPEFVSTTDLPLPVTVPVYNEGSSSTADHNKYVKKPESGGGGNNLSQQSIAARVRRRKITEKTQELGKLIPGGQKMNTAEMFQAAFKYIKLLQAQVGVLQLMHQEENEEGMYYSPELEALVTSPLVQEKLYSAEKCLVPTTFVKTLTQKPQLQSNPQLIKDLNKLI